MDGPIDRPDTEPADVTTGTQGPAVPPGAEDPAAAEVPAAAVEGDAVEGDAVAVDETAAQAVDAGETASDEETVTSAVEGGIETHDTGRQATPAGWVPPGPGSSGRRTLGCIIAAVIAFFVPIVVGSILLVFLGGQIQSMLKGTIEFGTGGTGCSVTGKATTFPASSTIHFAAYLEREVLAGEVITLVVTDPEGRTDTRDEPPATETVDCLFLDIQPGLPPGHYAIEFRTANEVLSQGEFDVTP